MSFIIRTLKRRPGGRVSIRERSVQTDDLRMGRGPDNDLELADLNVSLDHARISRSADGKLVLKPSRGNSVSINGRLVSGRARILKPETILRIGIYELRIEVSPKSSATVLSVEQMEMQPARIGSDDAGKVFSLKNSVPAKRMMAWVLAVGILAVFLILPIFALKGGKNILPMQADSAWNSGPISLMHANLKSDCQTCHVKAFVAVKDAACLDCHTKLKDHAAANDMQASQPQASAFGAKLNQVSEMFGRPVQRCASCHVEHNTKAKIIPTDQQMCADCHGDLDSALPNTKLINVSDFGSDHPQFHPSVITRPDVKTPSFSRISLDENPKGFSGLKFPHKLHLETSGGVAQMAVRLGEVYGFADGVDCADCHREETGGALFEPVNMRQDCAMCHSLVFEDDEGYERTLRHGEPEEVIAGMRDFYLAKALANIRDAEMNTRTRRRPGRAARLRDINRRELAFKQADERTSAKVEAIFSKGGACFDCHEIDRPADPASLDFRVRPISVNDRFYPKSIFDHAAHDIGNLQCEDCHKASKSNTSADILLPKIEQCRTCHVGEESYRAGGKMAEGTLPTTCLTCHSYHDGPHGGSMASKEQ